MVDRLTPERRSWLMSRVKGKNTTPEMHVRKAAHKMGLRFMLHRKDLPGKPDLVFPKYKVAIFVHGCFWHRHEGCPKAGLPKSRITYWAEKFDANVERDRRIANELSQQGWRVETIWECESKQTDQLAQRLRNIFKLN